LGLEYKSDPAVKTVIVTNGDGEIIVGMRREKRLWLFTDETNIGRTMKIINTSSTVSNHGLERMARQKREVVFSRSLITDISIIIRLICLRM